MLKKLEHQWGLGSRSMMKSSDRRDARTGGGWRRASSVLEGHTFLAWYCTRWWLYALSTVGALCVGSAYWSEGSVFGAALGFVAAVLSAIAAVFFFRKRHR